MRDGADFFKEVIVIHLIALFGQVDLKRLRCNKVNAAAVLRVKCVNIGSVLKLFCHRVKLFFKSGFFLFREWNRFPPCVDLGQRSFNRFEANIKLNKALLELILGNLVFSALSKIMGNNLLFPGRGKLGV